MENTGIPQTETKYRLEASLCVPSSVHGYCLAVEYMRDWFLDKFNDKYFKTVFINGKYVLDDLRKLSIGELVKRNKPAVAITPTVNFEYDRNNQDTYMGGKEKLISTFNHSKGFFRDWDKNIFLGLNLRELEVGFNFRVRVSTRAQQIDLYRHMELAFKIGFTQYQYLTVDFHIPMELMQNIALHAGFEMINDEIADIVSFVNYVNSHSEFPVVYKLRAINGKNEFFMRVPNVYAHIACLDKLSADDGEREGVTDNNFHVEMMAVLRMWVPQYYVFKSAQKITNFIPTEDSNSFGIYTFKIFDIPETNSRKWNKYMVTAWEFDDEEMNMDNIKIDLGRFFNERVRKVIDKHVAMGISPASFFEVVLYNYDADSSCSMDWLTYTLTVPKAISGRIHIVLYLDSIYFNEQQLVIEAEEKK